MRLLDFRHLTGYDRPDLVDVRDGEYRIVDRENFSPSVIIGMTFGKANDRGSYNYRIAESMVHARDYFGNGTSGVPLIAQREVHNHLDIFGLEGFVEGVGPNLEKNTFLGTDVKTRDIFVGTYDFMGVSDIIYTQGFDPSKILYAAHPAHIFRVMEMGKKVKLADESILEGEPFVDQNSFYNPTDGQWFARGEKAFVFRDFLVRVHHKLKGWV